MREHHKQVIERLVALHGNDSRYIGLIICGSLATGTARDDSDVDLYLVATDEEFTRVRENSAVFYTDETLCDYEGGEIDGKIINMQFLHDAVLHGSEPTRASFYKAFTAFSHTEEIDSLIRQIPIYPENERERKIKAFYSQVLHNQFYAEQAMALGNDYLKIRSVTDMVYFAVRLALTYNRILFPCHKSMFDVLKQAEHIPENFIADSQALLANMTLEKMNAYYRSVLDFYADCRIPEPERVSVILENEWSWFTGLPSVCDW